MGNSGSAHNIQSGLKELHTYYQIQSNDHDRTAGGVDDFSDKSNSLMLQMSKSRTGEFTSLAAANTLETNDFHQVKVLPIISENLRLKSTKNGAILHSGGTISGRRESLVSSPTIMAPLIERSKTFIAENSDDCTNKNPSSDGIMPIMHQRSQTQLDIDIRKRNRNKMVDENVNFKRFSSNIDLRKQTSTKENIETHWNETFQKLSKTKLKTKKRKAPPVPESSTEIPANAIIINDIERKQRLFKTKIETTAYPRKQPIKQSQHDDELSTVVMRTNLRPGFRREKSFDSKLLLAGTSGNSKLLQKELTPFVADVAVKRRSLQITMDKSHSNKKLEVATRLHSHSIKRTADHSARQRDPSEERRTLVTPTSKPNRPETQSKIPQLKKTFYFGMESSKQKQLLTTGTLTNDSSRKVEKINETKNSLIKDLDEVYSLNNKYDSEMKRDNGIQLKVRPTLPRRQLEIPRFSPVAAWRTLSVADEHRKELHLHTTKTSTSPSLPSLNAAIETANIFLFEDRIHRTYRDPCPFYADNKSGDSGISGDDGYMVEKPIEPQNLEYVQNNFSHDLANFEGNYPGDELNVPIMGVVGPFLTAWTPQQDLEDEDESSSDGGKVEMIENRANPLTPTSPHIFSLSLPRENQLAFYREKNKMDFRSLQKLKRTASNELNVINDDCNQSSKDSQNNLVYFNGDHVCLGNNFRSDNWVLSKTNGTIAAASTQVNNNSKNNVNRVHSSNPIESNSYFDMSVSAQQKSLGSLATVKHVMYLPNQSTSHEFSRQSKTRITRPNSGNLEDCFFKNIPKRNTCFSFQSSVRQIERRQLAERLSKEADQKEALRKSELEAMRRVEEEFQKKRAYEKASIRQQLQLYSMDDDNFMSLPNLNDCRAEPDGAVSSVSELSPVPKTSTVWRKNL